MSVGPVARDGSTAEFFDGAAAGRFLIRQCPDGHFSEPAAAACTTCGRTELRWVPATGGATLVSWAVAWGRPTTGTPPAQPEAQPARPKEQSAQPEAQPTRAEAQSAQPTQPTRTVLVIAELDEGPWWWSQLDLLDPADEAGIAVGRRLRVEFRRAGPEYEAVPVFVLA
jgi:uncharacterized protein